MLNYGKKRKKSKLENVIIDEVHFSIFFFFAHTFCLGRSLPCILLTFVYYSSSIHYNQTNQLKNEINERKTGCVCVRPVHCDPIEFFDAMIKVDDD